MMGTCFNCRKKSGELKMISFIYNDLQFTIFKSGLECEQCAKNFQ